MPAKYGIKGLDEAYKMMNYLSAIDKRKVIIGVLRSGANKNIKNKLEQANTHKPSKSRRKKPFITANDRKNKLGVLSGVSSKFYHYRFIEYGTKARYTKRTRRKAYRGRMPKKPFVSRIIQGNINNLTNHFANNFGKEVKKRLDRMANKNK